MYIKEKETLIRNLQAEVDKNRSILRKVKTNKTLYHIHFHVANAIENEIKLIKLNKIN